MTVAVAPSNGNATVDKSSLTFTASDWDTAQTVTVTGLNDDIDNASDLTATISNTPSGGGYGNSEAESVSVTVTNDDTKGLTLSASTLTVAEGGTGTYTVVLDSEPTADVTVAVLSSNGNATVDKSSLTFTASNWDTAQTVTVTGLDDDFDNPTDLTATISNTPIGWGLWRQRGCRCCGNGDG